MVKLYVAFFSKTYSNSIWPDLKKDTDLKNIQAG